MTERDQIGRTGRDLEPEFEHPRGTLAIVVVFGALFALGWFVMYAWLFLSRGTPR